MNMERIVIKDFGPIKTADITVKKINLLIGHTASGKSTVAKLISLFNSVAFYSIASDNSSLFIKLLEKYNISFNFLNTTLIEYYKDDYYWKIGKASFDTNYIDTDLVNTASSESASYFFSKFIQKKKDVNGYSELVKSLDNVLNIQDKKENSLLTASFLNQLKNSLLELIINRHAPVYIPAERLLITTFSNSLYGLLQEGLNIPDCIKDFGSLYERARNEKPLFSIDFMGIDVAFSRDEGDSVILRDENSTKLRISQASSGFQSIIPLWIVFDNFVKDKGNQLIVIEEPELNLFPTVQASLIENMMRRIKKSDNKIVITTHSPYVLSAIDNFILANDIACKHKDDLEFQKKIMDLVPSRAWVDFDEVSSYFFSDSGLVDDIADYEFRSLGAERIDEASNVLGNIYDELSELRNYAL